MKVEDGQAFQDEVEHTTKKVLVKFEADWCTPCRAMEAIVEEVARKHPEVKVVAVDVEGEGMEPILRKYKIRSIPTFVRVQEGVSVRSASGTISKAELSSLIEE